MKIHIVLTGRGQTRGDQLPGHIELPENSSVSDALAALTAALPEGETLPEGCLLVTHDDRISGQAEQIIRLRKGVLDRNSDSSTSTTGGVSD